MTTTTPPRPGEQDFKRARSVCRHCHVAIAVPAWAFSMSTWVHVDPRSGLLGSDQCYPTTFAEPFTTPGGAR